MHGARVSFLVVLTALWVSCGPTNAPRLNDQGSSRPAEVYAKEPPVVRVQNNKVPADKGHTPRESMSEKWKAETVDSTAGAEYLTEGERQLIIEVNMLRTDPAEYARRFLVPLRQYYRNKLIERPGEMAVSTHEGIRALDDCIKALQSAKPVSPLTPKKGLTLAARDHAKDQARTGAAGHNGSDGSTDETRINRYGKWDISAGENIDYGHESPRGIVTSLLIDDGVPSRGHRKNLLNGTFKFIGVSVGAHPTYGHMCVMDFAGSYR